MVAFSQVKPASIKLRMLPKFPMRIDPGAGIHIDKSNGIVTISTDFSGLAYQEAPTPAQMAASYVPIWDKENNLLSFVPTSYAGEQGPAGIPGDMVNFNSRSQAAATTVPVGVQFFRAAGYDLAGDRGNGLYKRVISEPSHPGKVQTADGAWWEISENLVNLRMFGAVGNDETKDTDAWIKAQQYLGYVGGGILQTTRGTFNIAQTAAPTVPIMFEGEVGGYDDNPFSGMPANRVSKIVWTGGHDPVFNFTSLWNGWGVKNVDVNCSNAAYSAVTIDSACGGFIQSSAFRNFLDFGLLGLAQHSTASYNYIGHTVWESNIDGNSCMDFDRAFVYANCCHWTFQQTRMHHTHGRTGLYLGACDNLYFGGVTLIDRGPGGTGAGVFTNPDILASFPCENHFEHLEAGAGGWVQPGTTTISPAMVNFFQSPAPVLNNTKLTYTESNSGQHNICGLNPSYMLNGRQVVGPTAIGFTPMTGPADATSVFNTGTVNLDQLAQRVSSLQEIMRQHGLIG